VTDFIANSFARVQGVGINFDGELSAVKGDSTYIFDRTLRLQGILQSKSSGGGLDFHPMNKGFNSTPLNTRLSFVASSEPVIDIFDTYCYQKVASVPIRDPIIGPVRASIRPNGQIVLIGATVRGVLVAGRRHGGERSFCGWGTATAGGELPLQGGNNHSGWFGPVRERHTAGGEPPPGVGAATAGGETATAGGIAPAAVVRSRW
jgi:hypothetical protein